MSPNRQGDGPVGFAVPISLSNTVAFVAEQHSNGVVLSTHWHDVDQLIYAATGVAIVETAVGIWVVPPARAVWVPAATSHSIVMTGDVHLNSAYVRPGAAPIDRDRCCVVHVSPLLREVMLRGTSTTRRPTDEAYDHLIAVFFDEVESAGLAPLELPLPTDPRAREVAVAFLADTSQRLTRAQWAKRVNTSERTLERLFAQETGTTLGRWQTQARLLEALRLLATGESVTRVAVDVGFDTSSAFIAMFRRALGTTPRRYFNN